MIYLDNSASTKPHPAVLEAFNKVSERFWANPSSNHQFGGQAEALLAKSRQQIADILGVNASEIIFTSGGTESNNLAIKGVAASFGNRGKHIITSIIEHPSVSKPYAQLEAQGFEVTQLPVDSQGSIAISDLKNAMRDDTILVSIMHVNNEIGSVQPIKEIGAVIQQYPKAFFHVDGIQGFSKVPLDLREAHVDLYSLSAHKFHGLKGTGILFVRDGILLESVLAGGNQERKLRSGTVNVAGAVSIAKAMRIANENADANLGNLTMLRNYFFQELKKIPQIVLNSPEKNGAPQIVNFSVPSLNAEVFVRLLEEKDIYVSSTSACSSKTKAISQVVKSLGHNEKVAASSIRVSLCFDTTKEEIDLVLQAINENIDKLSEVTK